MIKQLKIEKSTYLYACIIILQLLSIAYWANTKTNFYIDELYSMGYASNFTGKEDTAQYITFSEEWKPDEWINNATLKKYLLISEKEQVIKQPFIENIKSFFTQRNYFWLLNFIESIFGYDIVTARPGIFLNMILFIMAESVLIALLYKLKLDSQNVALCLAMFGFSGFFIGLTVFIRFYMLVILMALLVIFLHCIIWLTDKMWQVFVCEIVSLVLVYLMVKNTETTVPFIGGLIGCFLIGLLAEKYWKKLFAYFFAPAIAGLYILLDSKYRTILFNLEDIPYTANIFKTDLGRIWDNYIYIKSYLEDFYFGHKLIALLWGIGWIAFIYYFLFYSKKNRVLHKETGYAVILGGTFIIYSIFIILTGMAVSTRYYSFGVLLFSIVFWYAVDKIICSSDYIDRKSLQKFLISVVLLSCIAPIAVTRDIEYIYEEEAEFIENLKNYQGMDTVLMGTTDDEGVISRHEVYDCVNLMNEETDIYPVDTEIFEYQSGMFSKEILLWYHVSRIAPKTIRDLQEDGYVIVEVGKTHTSAVYYARK